MISGSIIACISVGETTKLEIYRGYKCLGKYSIAGGSLYSMEGNFQSFLKHAIPQNLFKGPASV